MLPIHLPSRHYFYPLARSCPCLPFWTSFLLVFPFWLFGLTVCQLQIFVLNNETSPTSCGIELSNLFLSLHLGLNIVRKLVLHSTWRWSCFCAICSLSWVTHPSCFVCFPYSHKWKRSCRFTVVLGASAYYLQWTVIKEVWMFVCLSVC